MATTTTARIEIDAEFTFGQITARALRAIGPGCECKTCGALAYLECARETDPKASKVGATYKQLAYIGHRVGMSTPERVTWYENARRLNLSQAHAGTIIVRLRESAKLFAELEAFLSQAQHS